MWAADIIKDELILTPVLALLASNGQYTTVADACGTRVGYFLHQELLDKVLKPISSWSGSFFDDKRWYDTTHKERLDVIWAVLMLGPYPDGSYFTMETSNQTLC